MGKAKEIARVTWKHHGDGTVTLLFENCLTGAASVKTYKTRATAKGAQTKFFNRAGRIYGRDLVGSRVA